MTNESRTFEQRVRDGVPVGRVHTIILRKGEQTRRALLLVGKRRPYKVEILAEPMPGDMYITWDRVTGDKLALSRMVGCTYVHRDHVMAEFGDPIKTIDI